MRTYSSPISLLLLAISMALPALIPLATVQAQAGVPLAAKFHESAGNSAIHTGSRSMSQLAVRFSRRVGDFGTETSSVDLDGAELSNIRRVSIANLEGGLHMLYIFDLLATADGPITFRLVGNKPCDSGGICTPDGTRLTRVPPAHVIAGPVTVSFDSPAYSGGGILPAEIVVTMNPAPLREVAVPLTATYEAGLNEQDDFKVPSSLLFSSGDTMKTIVLTTPEGGFEGEQGTINNSFGDLPSGISAGTNSVTEVTIQQDEIWNATMKVGGSQGYLGYSTFSGETEGSITDEQFSWRGTTYTVKNVVFSPADDFQRGSVGFDISPGFEEESDTLCLVMEDLGLNLADGKLNDRQYFWSTVELDWDEDDTVEVGLREFHPTFPIRSSDGRYNNPGHSDWGKAGTQLLRRTTVSYMDRVSAAPTWLPNARSISNSAMAQDSSVLNAAMSSSMLWQWGQFLDHDISHTPPIVPVEFLPIAVPLGDPVFDSAQTGQATLRFVRSEFYRGTGAGPDNPREQVNNLTAFIDASQVYGSNGARARALRINGGTGKLRASGDGRFLPYNLDGLENEGGNQRRDLFLAGDVRANEQVGLTALHTLFMREHNRLAEETARQHPHLDGDSIYEIVRKIVGAQMQVITFNEFLPLILGPDAIDPYEGYDPSVDPTITNEFSTSAFRVGHTMLPPELLRISASGNEDEISLADAFFDPTLPVDRGISEFLVGLTVQQAQEVDLLIVDEVRNLLFREQGVRGMDLAALNIQRNRDHGVADYNSVRQAYGLTTVTDFSGVSSDPDVQQKLRETYGEVGDSELWVTGLAEDHVEGAMVGKTFHSIISEQFHRLRDGDRFWFENDPYFRTNPELLDELRATTLAEIIRRNTSISNEISDDVFVISESER